MRKYDGIPDTTQQHSKKYKEIKRGEDEEDQDLV